MAFPGSRFCDRVRFMKQFLKTADVVIICAVAVIIGIMTFQIYRNGGDAAVVRIDAAGRQWIYPIDQNDQLFIPGPLGNTEVVIEDGHVHVPDSPCTNKICVSTGEIRRSGQWIICLPNDVFVRIEGELPGDEEVDDVVF